MLELEENILVLKELNEKIRFIRESMKIDSLILELKKLENESLKEGFWDDIQNSNKTFSKINNLKRKISSYTKLEDECKSLIEFNELLEVEFDESLYKDLLDKTKKLQDDIEKMQIYVLFSGKYDSNNCIITMHPGAGGTESQDWVEMLYRMYSKWASSNGYTIKELYYLAGDEAGIKSVSFLVSGEYAYGYLKGESGVHRLVRISPFDSGGRRHTSFASVEVLPEINDDTEVEINSDDIRIDTFRASGAGGQHINKTDSAVRITHIPTNIVVSCQSERSQTMNKETAMKMLRSKLVDLKEKENEKHLNSLKGEQKDIAWGSQIRSYVFCPYTLVKDHRTGYETGNVQAVMDGDINGFMESYLKQNSKNNSNIRRRKWEDVLVLEKK